MSSSSVRFIYPCLGIYLPSVLSGRTISPTQFHPFPPRLIFGTYKFSFMRLSLRLTTKLLLLRSVCITCDWLVFSMMSIISLQIEGELIAVNVNVNLTVSILDDHFEACVEVLQKNYMSAASSSTEDGIDTRLTKAWTAIDRLSIIWKSDLTDKMKRSFFQAAVVSILLYDAPHGRLRSGWRGGWTEITQECWEQY